MNVKDLVQTQEMFLFTVDWNMKCKVKVRNLTIHVRYFCISSIFKFYHKKKISIFYTFSMK